MDKTIAINEGYAEKYGFKDKVDYQTKFPPGLTEETIRSISKLKNEPEWMLNIRLEALKIFFKKAMPTWGADLSGINFDKISYFARASDKKAKSWEDLPENIRKTFDKLGIPEAERNFLAGVGAQYESEVLYHKLREDLEKKGVIFSDTDTAVHKYPELLQEWFGRIIPAADNKFAALNTACWSGGSFIYVPPGVKVDLPLQAYFRINEPGTGQFERTLIIADKGSEVHYIEGCSAPIYQEDSLHSAVVEIVALEGARVRYITIQNWSNNVYNLVTKRAYAYKDALVEWLDCNIGSKVTMKYPSVYLKGEGAKANILSVAFAGAGQTQDTGAKAIHLSPNTSSTILAKSVSKDGGKSAFRGLVKAIKGARNTKSHMRCVKPDTMLLGHNKQISEYKINDYVIGVSGFNKVNQTFVSDFKGEMFQINGAGSLPVEVTKEHPLFVTKSKNVYYKKHDGKYSCRIELGEPYWENPENLIPKKSNNEGHYLAIPRILGNVQDKSISLKPFIKNENIASIIRKDIPLNNDVAWLMGLYVAEGSSDDQGHVKFALNKNEKKMKSKIIKIANHLGYSAKFYEKKAYECMEVSLFSNVLSRAFREWFGSGASNKKMPDFILLNKNEDLIKSFLFGYTSGDGCISKNCSGKRNVTHLVTVSKVLALQLQLLGARLGRFYRITKVYDNKEGFILGRKVNFKTKYEIRSNSSKRIHAKITDKYLFIPIRSANKIYYRGQVYNIETQDHTYLVNNIITHNCDALILDKKSKSDTFPTLEIDEHEVSTGHEATVGKVSEDQLFYLMSRGLTEQQAVTMIVSGFLEEFVKQLPFEYAVEFNRLIELEMTNAIN